MGDEPACELPDRAWLKKRFDQEWSAGHTANLSIGQGYVQATPQQVVGAIGTIANDGTYIQPHLLLGEEPKKRDLTKNKVAPETIELVKSALFDTVNAEDGTGQRARLEGRKIYGKTGTAQWKPGKYLAWFSGWAGDSGEGEQRYAITVVVENGQSGGKVAAPLARMILADCLLISNKAPGEKLAPTRLEAYEGHVNTIDALDEK